MVHSISILGSTGSIGRQTVAVAEHLGLNVRALTTNRNIQLAEEQARRLHPAFVAVTDETAARALRIALADTDIAVGSGENALCEAAVLSDTDAVVTAVSGAVGLRPTLAAIRAGKRIALANKETLVCAGELVMAQAERWGADIVPVDSEHSAIFQCLNGEYRNKIDKILLTASGGPFRGWTRKQMEHVQVEDALKHPNWSMGAKVTIDSATLMNKGLELLEAMSLFAVPPEKIQILIHRESILHSAVEYCDNSVIAQLGAPDMRLPIQYALSWPDRVAGPAEELDLFAAGQLTFAKPDLDTFPCLALAIRAAQEGGTAPAILNGANEVAVARFLAGEIGFLDIPRVVAHALDTVPRPPLTLEGVYAADQAARQAAKGEA